MGTGHLLQTISCLIARTDWAFPWIGFSGSIRIRSPESRWVNWLDSWCGHVLARDDPFEPGHPGGPVAEGSHQAIGGQDADHDVGEANCHHRFGAVVVGWHPGDLAFLAASGRFGGPLLHG